MPIQNITIIPLSIFNDNYVWLIKDSKREKAICVDPGESKVVLNYLKQHKLDLDSILITHHHQDHIDGLSSLLEHFPKCNVYAPNEPRIQLATTKVSNNQTINIEALGLNFKVIATPGHTSSHICYFANLETEPLLFCGDTLFSGGCGRLFEGTAEQMLNSLKTLSNLPDNTTVFCAHEYTRSNLEFYKSLSNNNLELNTYINKLKTSKNISSLPSTISIEKKINPFLRCATIEFKEIFKEKVEPLTELDIFSHLRKLKDNY